MANGRLGSVQAATSSRPVLPPAEGIRPQPRRLLEDATVAFAERGYHGVSVRDLTRAVGIQAASFYSHFQSKEQLLFEIIRLGHQAHQAAVRDALLSAGSDPADQLREGIRANVVFQATYPLLTIVCNSELHALSAEHRAGIFRIRHEEGVLVGAVIERGNNAGEFSCPHPWLAMSAMAAMGVRIAWWFRPISDGDGSPLSDYPIEAMKWLQSNYTLEEIADEYANYALSIVGYRGESSVPKGN